MTSEHERPGLIETMSLAAGRIRLLDRHIERLARSARHFGYPFDEPAFRIALQREMSRHSAQEYRLRTTLSPAGRVSFSSTRPDRLDLPLKVGLYDVIVDSADELLYHKTTARALYDRAYLEAREGGLDEVLFFNERGELTEGSRSNVFLRRGDLLLTPPVTSGLLAGVCRRDVLQSGSRIRESVLFLHDLESAEEVMLANAVMGLVAARYTGLRIGANRRCGRRSA